MMIDADVAVCSPSSVYRVLKDAGRLDDRPLKPSSKGKGFVQPLRPHEHRVSIGGTEGERRDRSKPDPPRPKRPAPKSDLVGGSGLPSNGLLEQALARQSGTLAAKTDAFGAAEGWRGGCP